MLTYCFLVLIPIRFFVPHPLSSKPKTENSEPRRSFKARTDGDAPVRRFSKDGPRPFSKGPRDGGRGDGFKRKSFGRDAQRRERRFKDRPFFGEKDRGRSFDRGGDERKEGGFRERSFDRNGERQEGGFRGRPFDRNGGDRREGGFKGRSFDRGGERRDGGFRERSFDRGPRRSFSDRDRPFSRGGERGFSRDRDRRNGPDFAGSKPRMPRRFSEESGTPFPKDVFSLPPKEAGNNIDTPQDVTEKPTAGPETVKAPYQNALKGETVLWGTHAVKAALLNPARKASKLYATLAAKSTLDADGVSIACPLDIQPASFFGLKLPGAIHQGLMLEASALDPTPPADLLNPEGADESKPRLLLALDGIQDPHNMGALFRSAMAFGADGIVFPNSNTAPLEGAMAKAAAGALETLPFSRPANLRQFLTDAKKAGFWVWGLDENGEPLETVLASPAKSPAKPEDDQPKEDGTDEEDVAPVRTAPKANALPQKIVLVLGAEGAGIRPLIRKELDQTFGLKTNPDFPTLNVSVAGAVALALIQGGRKH